MLNIILIPTVGKAMNPFINQSGSDDVNVEKKYRMHNIFFI